jgi:hypothetical protein
VNHGYELDIETAVDLVREDYVVDTSSLFGGLDGDALVSALGEDIVKKIRKHDLARLKARTTSQQPAAENRQSPSQPRADRNQPPKHMKQHEWLEMIRKKAGM